MVEEQTLTLEVKDETFQLTCDTLQGVFTFIVSSKDAIPVLERALAQLKNPPPPKPKPRHVIPAILRGRS